jgi:nitronate monooxygenase
MAITTPFTELFGVDHPLVLAPMGGVSGGALAAAVSEAGGLGLVGGGYGDPRWLERELQLVAGATGKPWGVGVITWAVGEDIVRLALSWRPAAVFLSFGNPAPFGALVKEAGTRLICQVQDVAGARQAAAAGADVIVAQGTEAGGHGSRRATLPLVPAVADAVAPVPVLAAGGIADGRGVAAALMLGAQGVVLGTRFCATPEALYSDWAKKQLVAGGGDATSRTQVFDIARGLDWPSPYTGRAMRNAFADRWDGREAELRADSGARDRFARGHQAGDPDVALVWAGEGTDLITAVEPAGDLVTQIMAQAEGLLRGAARRLDH